MPKNSSQPIKSFSLPIKAFQRFWIIYATSVFISACSTPYPLNMSEEQWKQLSNEQQTQLLLEEQKNRAERAKVQQAADNRARELVLQAEIAETKRLEKLYADPENGHVLRVNILGGQWSERKESYKIQPESYRIALGESKQIELTMLNSKGYSYKRDIWLEYRADGDAVYLKEYHHDDEKISLLNQNQWACGQEYQKQLKDRYQTVQLNISISEVGNSTSCRHSYKPRRYDDTGRIPPMR